MGKNPLTSKTFWFNLLTTIIAVLGVINEQSWVTPQMGAVIIATVGVINIALRFVTTQPLGPMSLPKFSLLLPLWLSLVVGTSANSLAWGQDSPALPPAATGNKPPAAIIEANGDAFHSSVIRAAIELHKKGELKRGELIKLRVAMLAPGFRAQAKQLAVVQMATSGSDSVPLSDDGTVDEVAIDWAGVASFLQAFIPLLLQLINAFSGSS